WHELRAPRRDQRPAGEPASVRPVRQRPARPLRRRPARQAAEHPDLPAFLAVRRDNGHRADPAVAGGPRGGLRPGYPAAPRPAPLGRGAGARLGARPAGAGGGGQPAPAARPPRPAGGAGDRLASLTGTGRTPSGTTAAERLASLTGFGSTPSGPTAPDDSPYR